MRTFSIAGAIVLVGHVVDARNLSDAETKDMLMADVIILGEIHDNAEHHIVQARLLSLIQPKAVVFEMLDAPMAEAVNNADRGDVAEWGDQIGWEAAGWPDYALYLPVFDALGDAVVVGAATDRASVRAAFDQGAAAVFGADAARFGLDAHVPVAQLEARMTLQFEAHCKAMPVDLMGGMVEAQRLRDAAFSAAALRALQTHGAPVAVITGNGHARRDWAMPFMITRAAPDVAVYSIGLVEAPAFADDPRFDATLVTAAAPRNDPCAAFNK